MDAMPLEERMEHVNRCLDEDENVSQAANKLAEHNFDACPICFKESECHIEHLKKCAKQQSVFPKDLIHIIQRYEKESGNRVKSRKRGPRAKKTTPVQRKAKKSKSQPDQDENEEAIPHKSKSPVQSIHFAKTLTVCRGRLTAYADLPDRNEIQDKLDAFLKNSVILNFRTAESPVSAAQTFSLSSFLIPHIFIARGFDRFVCKTNSNPVNPVADSLPVESGFLKECTVIQIDKKDEFFDRLWQQKDKKSADLLLRTDDGSELACHSFVWCMNTGKPRLIRCGSMFRVDCSTFSKSMVQAFVSFCYSGKMRVETEMEQEMRSFCSHFECNHLLQ